MGKYKKRLVNIMAELKQDKFTTNDKAVSKLLK